MCSTDNEFLLHPELLSRESLIEIITARRVKIDGLKQMTRDRLIEIFNQFCLPHAQRKSRNQRETNQNEVKKIRTNSSDFFITSKLQGTSLTEKCHKIKVPMEYSQNEDNRKKIKFHSTSGYNEIEKSSISYKRKLVSETASSNPSESESRTKKVKTQITWP